MNLQEIVDIVKNNDKSFYNAVCEINEENNTIVLDFGKSTLILYPNGLWTFNKITTK